MTFSEKLNQALAKSPICVGLDSDPDKIPHHLHRFKNPVLEFNKYIIDSTFDLVGAYKPNLAFYEAHGTLGHEALTGTLEHIRKRAPHAITIADAKRGDIGNTAAMYARAAFKDLGCDCVTVNPYMGEDAVLPFLSDPAHGAFLLCLTSNTGSRDFQYLESGGKRLFEQVAEKAIKWNQHGNCGLVVGATRTDDFKAIRRITGNMPFLIPGIGAQGGDLESTVRENTSGGVIHAFINSSRAILYASSGEDFAFTAREAVLALQKSILAVK